MADLLYIASKTFHNKVEDNKVTSPYGMRIHPITKVEKMHNGVDFSSKTLPWKQYPLEDGYVYSAGVDTAYGNALFAWIAYPRLGIRCLHYHLEKLYVEKGQTVTKDTVIGLTGKSGYSDGVHLHLGVKWLSNGKYFNPQDIDLKEDEIEEQEEVKQEVSSEEVKKFNLTVNGIWNMEFTKALQTYFGTTVDGIIGGQLLINPNIRLMRKGIGGSQLVKAIQKWLGITQDGYFGRQTIRALQKKMGTTVDGNISSVSYLVKVMQKKLNEDGKL